MQEVSATLVAEWLGSAKTSDARTIDRTQRIIQDIPIHASFYNSQPASL